MLLSLAACAAPPIGPHNLVVVCLDTVRYDTFWLPEKAAFEDDLAPWLERSLTLDQTQAPAPWTVPFVASLLTGLYPNQHGAGRFVSETANLSEEVPSGILSEVSTLPEILTRQGYEAVAYVAHPWFTPGYGLDRGFAHLEMRAGRTKLLASAMTWLDARRRLQATTEDVQRPFLLYLHFMEAHEKSHRPLGEIDEMVPQLPAALKPFALSGAPAGICVDHESAPCRRYQAYVVSILELRETVAQLLGEISARGLSDDTITVVYSDHGEEFRDHLDEEVARGLDPRNIYGIGHGHSLYQELLHVPVVIWHPQIQGRRLTSETSLIDLMPSLFDWLRMAPGVLPQRGPGVEINRLLASETSPRERYLFSSGIAYGPQQVAVRSGSVKRVLDLHSGKSSVFHLHRDPGEREPERLSAAADKLDGLLSNYAALLGASDGGITAEISKDNLERLQALGYLGAVDTDN